MRYLPLYTVEHVDEKEKNILTVHLQFLQCSEAMKHLGRQRRECVVEKHSVHVTVSRSGSDQDDIILSH